MALRNGAHALCEKPLVINPWNLDAIEQIEPESGRRVYTVLQLRVHPALIELKQKLDAETRSTRRQVVLTYVTSRGRWYDMSWKGIEERSGGIATNIGIHFFDLLIWLFGPMQRSEVHLRERRRMGGFVELAGAEVRWLLSLETSDLPYTARPGERSTHRSITADAQEIKDGRRKTGDEGARGSSSSRLTSNVSCLTSYIPHT
ncbi:MAG: Gfo/Idh/MocA family oxidoreductase [Acidobacteriota bacterium]